MSGTLSNGQVRRIAAAAGLGAGATLAMSGVAQASPMTFTVADTGDGTGAVDCATPTNIDCTLRQAIVDANGNTGADTIQFASGLSGTIILGGDMTTITDPVTIQGPGASVIEISGNDTYRIFDLKPTTDGDPVSISGVTLSHGNPDGSSTDLHRGGAILNETADLTLSNSIITGNAATSYAGAIYSGCDTACGAASHGSGYLANLTLTNSTLIGNTSAVAGGGAIYLNYGSATISNSTFVGNTGQWAGAVGIFDMQGPVLIKNTTIKGNTAGSNGGGVYADYNPSGVTISSSTIVGNTAQDGGGFYFGSAAGSPVGPNVNPVLHNTIVAGNTADVSGPDLFNGNSSSFDSAFSLIGSTSAASVSETVAGSDIVGVSPKLGPLAANGGSTATMLPLAGSPAIDKGSRFGLGADQRALTRPIDLADYSNSTAAGADGSDIGAVELQTSPGGGDVTPAAPTTPATPTTPKKKCKKKKHKRSAGSAKKKKCKKKK